VGCGGSLNSLAPSHGRRTAVVARSGARKSNAKGKGMTPTEEIETDIVDLEHRVFGADYQGEGPFADRLAKVNAEISAREQAALAASLAAVVTLRRQVAILSAVQAPHRPPDEDRPRIQWGAARDEDGHPALSAKWPRWNTPLGTPAKSRAHTNRSAELAVEIRDMMATHPDVNSVEFQRELHAARHDMGKAIETWKSKQVAPLRAEMKQNARWATLPEDWRDSATADDVLEFCRREVDGDKDKARALFMDRMPQWRPPPVPETEEQHLLNRAIAQVGGDRTEAVNLMMARRMGKPEALSRAPEELTLREAAALAGKSVNTLRRGVSAGELPTQLRAGKHVLSVNDYVAHATAKGWAPTALEANTIGSRDTWPRR
jgi:hypothetical protein